MIFKGLRLSCVSEKSLSFYRFWVQKCENQLFGKNKYFSAGFIELKYMWLQTGLVVLKKTPNTSNFVFGRLFKQFCKISYFPRFLKIVSS